MSDDEISSPKKNSLNIPQYYDNKMVFTASKKNCESSLNVAKGIDLDAAKSG